MLVSGDSRAQRSLSMSHAHNAETLRIPSLPPQTIGSDVWRRATRFWRSWRTQKRRTVHPGLLRRLANLQGQFDGAELVLVSGYRAPAAGDHLSSYHEVSRAADLQAVGVSKEELFLACQVLPQTGCGYYPKAQFVHVDVRSKSTVWVDLSPPGSPRAYVANPRAWLRKRGLTLLPKDKH